MQRTTRTLALGLALATPAALALVLGAVALHADSARALERYRELGEAARRAALERMEGALQELEAGRAEGALALRLDAQGHRIGASASEPAPDAPAIRDPVLHASLRNDVDRLQARGEQRAAARLLADAAAREEDPGLAAWALATRAALLERAGEAEGAQEAWRALQERFPRERSARGLDYGAVARYELARRAPEPEGAAELCALYAELVAREDGAAERALAAFTAELRAELGRRAELPAELRAELAELDRRDAEAWMQRALAAAARALPRERLEAGADALALELALPADEVTSANPLLAARGSAPLAERRALLALRRDAEGWSGAILGSARFFEQALRALEREPAFASLGFLPLVRDAEGRRSGARALAPDAAERAPAAEGPLAPPLEAYVLELFGEPAAFLAAERRRARLFALLVGLALAAAAAGAFATLRAVARESAASKQREDFVAAVTHELKTPLASIRLFAELLARGDVEPEKAREFGERTLRESDRLGRLVDSVLDLARIEQGAALRRERLDGAELAQSALATVEPLARGRGLALLLRSEGAPPRVLGDPDALHGALVALLENALAHSVPPAAIELELARAAHGGLALAVLDRGPGVPAELRERIFEPFARGGEELRRERPGVGLGLALVRRIAEAHGGRARCEAREGGGSRFVIELPAVEDHA